MEDEEKFRVIHRAACKVKEIDEEKSQMKA
jgi:hypothetical protein